MHDDNESHPGPEDGLGAVTDRTRRQSAELAGRLAELTDGIADSEQRLATVLEESARLRPHAADRLMRAAAEARAFADKERDHGRRLREHYAVGSGNEATGG